MVDDKPLSCLEFNKNLMKGNQGCPKFITKTSEQYFKKTQLRTHAEAVRSFL